MSLKHIILLAFNCLILMYFTGLVEWAFKSVYTNFLNNLKNFINNFNSLNMTGMVLQLSSLVL